MVFMGNRAKQGSIFFCKTSPGQTFVAYRWHGMCLHFPTRHCCRVIKNHSNDLHQCPILPADFVIFYYGTENEEAIQAGEGSEWGIEVGYSFSIPKQVSCQYGTLMWIIAVLKTGQMFVYQTATAFLPEFIWIFLKIIDDCNWFWWIFLKPSTQKCITVLHFFSRI